LKVPYKFYYSTNVEINIDSTNIELKINKKPSAFQLRVLVFIFF